MTHLTSRDDMLWLGEEVMQERPRAAAESNIPSSQKNYLYSARNAGGSRGGGDSSDTPTKANMRLRKVTLQEQAGPVAVSRINSSQKGDIDSGRGADGNSVQKGGSGRRSSPNRANTAVTEEALQEQPQPVVEPRSPQSSDIKIEEIAGASSGNKGGSVRRRVYISPLTMRRAHKGTHQLIKEDVSYWQQWHAPLRIAASAPRTH